MSADHREKPGLVSLGAVLGLSSCTVAGSGAEEEASAPSTASALAEQSVVEAAEAAETTEVVEVTAAPEIVEPEPFDYGTCPPTARACVDLDGQRAWLQENGEVTYEAGSIGHGGPGYETPRAEFQVSRKVEYDYSYIFDMAPMPFSVYFTDVGHAFHEGDPNGESHGCVRLAPGDAEVFYNALQVSDLIHIY